MRITASSPVVFAILMLLTIATILIHCSQYLPATASLFVAVASMRLAAAVFAGACCWISMTILKMVYFKTLRLGTILNISTFLTALAAVLMVIASRGNTVPQTLINLYLLRDSL